MMTEQPETSETSETTTAPDDGSRTRRRLRIRAVVQGIAFPPLLAIAMIMGFLKPGYGRCLSYGENCDPAPLWVPVTPMVVCVAAGLIALLLPRSMSVSNASRLFLVRTQLGVGMVALLVAFVVDASTWSHDDLSYDPETRKISSALDRTEDASAGILDLLALDGKVYGYGADASRCSGQDPETFYATGHSWNVTEAPPSDMAASMKRLKAELPRRGWNIEKYGPDSSIAKSLELVAEHEKKHLSLHVTFYDARNPKRSSPSQVDVRLGSRCFRFAPGETRDDAGGNY